MLLSFTKFFLILIAVFCVSDLLMASASSPTFNGLRIEPPKIIHQSTLLNGLGQATGFPLNSGKWQLVVFGYTNCPDVCPLSLQKTASLLKMLNTDSERLQIIFISIDSSRDSPQAMNVFTAKFDKRIIGLTGDPEALQTLENEFNVLTRRFQGKTALAYTLEHSSFMYLLDSQGRIRMLYPIATATGGIVQDLHILWQVSEQAN
ncbi:MAG: SCO family protein [Gammaproteobacteria bacterium]|nr:SCO family protein [Gammaproteobacteria bacterium]